MNDETKAVLFGAVKLAGSVIFVMLQFMFLYGVACLALVAGMVRAAQKGSRK